MVSSMLLTDMICGKENPYAEIFAPSRFSAGELPQIMQDSGKAVKGLAKRFFYIRMKRSMYLKEGMERSWRLLRKGRGI